MELGRTRTNTHPYNKKTLLWVGVCARVARKSKAEPFPGIAQKGAGELFGIDFNPRKGKTNTSQHFTDMDVQSSPGERRSLGGGHGKTQKVGQNPSGRFLNQIFSKLNRNSV